jgi:hypothetical protein
MVKVFQTARIAVPLPHPFVLLPSTLAYPLGEMEVLKRRGWSFLKLYGQNLI